MILNWKTSPEDTELITQIARRAVLLNEALDFNDALMDLTAVHNNGNPLRLAELLETDDLNFTHDVFGIFRYIDRDTGKLTECFVPRFSCPE